MFESAALQLRTRELSIFMDLWGDTMFVTSQRFQRSGFYTTTISETFLKPTEMYEGNIKPAGDIQPGSREQPMLHDILQRPEERRRIQREGPQDLVRNSGVETP